MDMSRAAVDLDGLGTRCEAGVGVATAETFLRDILGAARLTRLRSDLRVGFVDDRFRVGYEPKIRIADGAVVGLQTALLWDQPGVSTLSAEIFFAAAGLEGRHVDALRFLLAQACEDVVEWRERGISPGPVAIPVPTERLADGTVLDDLLAALRFTGVAPEFFSLDIHERAFSPALTYSTSAAVSRLADAGFRMAVCGFGTGGASLGALRCHAIDELKIDPGLLSGIGDDAVSSEIVRSIVALARTLAVDVLATGVLSAEQVAILKEIGCAFIQGPVVAPAMGGPACTAWVADRHRHHVASLSQAGDGRTTGADDRSGPAP